MTVIAKFIFKINGTDHRRKAEAQGIHLQVSGHRVDCEHDCPTCFAGSLSKPVSPEYSERTRRTLIKMAECKFIDQRLNDVLSWMNVRSAKHPSKNINKVNQALKYPGSQSLTTR